MRRTKRKTGFILSLILNLLLNLEEAMPAVLLLICHFAFGWSIWFALAAFLLWIVFVVVRMLIFGWYYNQDSDLPEKSKKVNNPYAKKGVIIKNGKAVGKNDVADN